MEVVAERGRQELIWGEENHSIKPHGQQWTRSIQKSAEAVKASCEEATANGTVTWYDIWYEEFLEVFAEDNPKKQREELIQAMAVNLAMVEYLDRRYPRKDE